MGQEDQGEFARVDYIDFIPKQTSLRVEAESMATTFRDEWISGASGGQVASLRGDSRHEMGHAFFEFNGPAGEYNVTVGYYDENDGVAQLDIQQGNTILDSWQLNQNLGSGLPNAQTFQVRTVANNLTLNPGDTFTLAGHEDRGEYARIDYIEFTPVASKIRVEAEAGVTSNIPSLSLNNALEPGNNSNHSSPWADFINAAKDKLASSLGQTIEWLENNQNAVALINSQDRTHDIVNMIENSEVYEWGRGSRGRYRQELLDLFWQRGLFSTLDDLPASESKPTQFNNLGVSLDQFTGHRLNSSPLDRPTSDFNELIAEQEMAVLMEGPISPLTLGNESPIVFANDVPSGVSNASKPVNNMILFQAYTSGVATVRDRNQVPASNLFESTESETLNIDLLMLTGAQEILTAVLT